MHVVAKKPSDRKNVDVKACGTIGCDNYGQVSISLYAFRSGDIEHRWVLEVYVCKSCEQRILPG